MPGLLTPDDLFNVPEEDLPPALALYATRTEPALLGQGETPPAPPADTKPADTKPPPEAPPPAAPAKPAEEGGGFWSGLSDVLTKSGLALAGGDPSLASLTPEQQRNIGTRSLLQFGLSMLANSGPSYTPRNFGQILAAGLESAGRVPMETEKAIAANQAKESELAMRRAGLQIQGLTAQARLEQLRMVRDQIKAGQTAVDRALGPSLSTPGDAGTPAPPLAPYVPHDLPEGVTPEEDLLVRTVYGEAGGESVQGQQAVTAVVRNRQAVGNQAASDVIFQPHAFQPWNDPATRKRLEALQPSDPQYQRILTQAVRPITSGAVPDPTQGSTHFYSPQALQALKLETPSWGTGEPVVTIGGHRFYKPGYQPPAVRVAGPGAGTAAAPAAAPGAATQTTTATTPAPPAGTTATPAAPASPPPAAAVDTPAIAAARAQAQRTRIAQLTALKGQQTPQTAEKVAAIEHEYQQTIEKLDAEARANADKIATEQRGEQTQIRQEQRRAAQEKVDKEAEAARQAELKRLESDLAARNNRTSTLLTADAKTLEEYQKRSASSRLIVRDIEPLTMLATRMGPANALMDTNFGKALRDTLVTLNLGTRDQIDALEAQQQWDRLISGLFKDTHVEGIGSQSDQEGRWLLQQWGGAGQSPDDRLTQLAIIRKLAAARIQDHEDANDMLHSDDASLKNLPKKLRERASVFDRAPAWNPDDPQNVTKQNAYVLSHQVGEPFKMYWSVGSRPAALYWSRRKVDGSIERLAADLPGSN